MLNLIRLIYSRSICASETMTCSNPLWTTWDRNVPTYPVEKFDHRWNRDSAVFTLPLSLDKYCMSRFECHLDVVRISLLQSDGEHVSVGACLWPLCYTTMGLRM